MASVNISSLASASHLKLDTGSSLSQSEHRLCEGPNIGTTVFD